MSQHPPDGPEAEHVATKDETISAWKAMTREDKIKLDIYAAQQARMRQRYAPGISGSELVNEAALRAFERNREWRLRKVSFLQFMFGIVRSIGGDLKRTNEGKLAAASMTEGDFEQADGMHGSQLPLDHRHMGLDTPEAIAIAKEQLAAFQSDFEDDEDAWYVLECRIEGLSGPETQNRLGIASKDFDAARKRIAGRIHKFFLSN
jgi:hypothetical protein